MWARGSVSWLGERHSRRMGRERESLHWRAAESLSGGDVRLVRTVPTLTVHSSRMSTAGRFLDATSWIQRSMTLPMHRNSAYVSSTTAHESVGKGVDFIGLVMHTASSFSSATSSDA